MDHASFILLSYLVSLGAPALLAVWVVRSGKRLARRLPDADKPWG